MRGVFLDCKFCLTSNPKFETAPRKRIPGEERIYLALFNRNESGLSIRLKRSIRPTSPIVDVNFHISTRTVLVRDNRERLRFRADTLGHAVFHIENISAGR